MREKGLEGERQKGLDQHEDAEDLESVLKAQGLHHLLEKHWEAHGEEATACCHHPVGKAQSAAKVVPQNDQGGLEGEGGTAAEQDTVGEIPQTEGAGGGMERE